MWTKLLPAGEVRAAGDLGVGKAEMSPLGLSCLILEVRLRPHLRTFNSVQCVSGQEDFSSFRSPARPESICQGGILNIKRHKGGWKSRSSNCQKPNKSGLPCFCDFGSGDPGAEDPWSLTLHPASFF